MIKKCPKCSSYRIKKNWTKLWSQRYKCNICGHVFQQSKKKVNWELVYKEYTEWKQTYKQLATKYGKWIRTIQRAIDKVMFKKKK